MRPSLLCEVLTLTFVIDEHMRPQVPFLLVQPRHRDRVPGDVLYVHASTDARSYRYSHGSAHSHANRSADEAPNCVANSSTNCIPDKAPNCGTDRLTYGSTHCCSDGEPDCSTHGCSNCIADGLADGLADCSADCSTNAVPHDVDNHNIDGDDDHPTHALQWHS